MKGNFFKIFSSNHNEGVNIMECNHFRELMSEYIDNTLIDSEKESMTRHLNECAECKNEYSSLWTMVKLLKMDNEVEVPLGFSEGLHKALKNVTPVAHETQHPLTPRRGIFHFSTWNRYYSLVGMAAAIVLVAGWIFYESPKFTGVESDIPSSLEQDSSKQNKQPMVPGVLEAQTEEKTKVEDSSKLSTSDNNITLPDQPKGSNQTKATNTTTGDVNKTQMNKEAIQRNRTNYATSNQKNVTQSTKTQSKTTIAQTNDTTSTSPESLAIPESQNQATEGAAAGIQEGSNKRTAFVAQTFESNSTTKTENSDAVRKVENAFVGVTSRNPSQCVNDISQMLQSKNLWFELKKNTSTPNERQYATIQLQLSASLAEQIKQEIQKKYKTRTSGTTNTKGSVNLTIQVQRK